MDMYIGRASRAANFREAIYSGAIFLQTSLRSANDLCEHAVTCAKEVFDNPTDLREVHKYLQVDEFVRLVTALKAKFTNSDYSKELIREFILEIGEDPTDFLFDVPRIRVVPDYDYLHAGVSYAYKAHRDTWYGSPQCQINTWMPVFPISPDQTMMINPNYFDKPVRNTSDTWSLTDWMNTQRWDAKSNILEETRPHPVPLDTVDTSSELHIAGDRGDMIIFSGAHLHGTVPNHTNQIRFSVDFRIMHTNDLVLGRGAPNLDSGCKDEEAGFVDYMRAADFSRFKEVSK